LHSAQPAQAQVDASSRMQVLRLERCDARKVHGVFRGFGARPLTRKRSTTISPGRRVYPNVTPNTVKRRRHAGDQTSRNATPLRLAITNHFSPITFRVPPSGVRSDLSFVICHLHQAQRPLAHLCCYLLWLMRASRLDMADQGRAEFGIANIAGDTGAVYQQGGSEPHYRQFYQSQ
jgi:hypothetical protein